MKYRFLLVLVTALVAVGCMPGSTLSGSALVHPNFPYAVTYDDEQQKSVMGDDWTLDNFRRKTSEGSAPPAIERKDGYETTYEFDFDDDTKTDAKQKLPEPDLLFIHRKTSARIEVSMILLDRNFADTELRILLNDVVDNANGTRSLFVGFGRVALGVQKHYASRLLDSEEATLGDQKGLVATIERADVDQLQLNPKARWRRSRLFLMHAPFDYYVAERFIETAKTTKFHKYRPLFLVEYVNTPEDFEAQYPEYLRLMNKVHMLSDSMLLKYLGAPLAKCSKEKQASLTVSISELGQPSIDSEKGFDPMCTPDAIDAYQFPATGAVRKATLAYDFNQPQKPDWLGQGEYKEQRPVAPVDEAAKPDAATPASSPPPAAPADATATPAPATPAPATPAPATPAPATPAPATSAP